MHKTCSKTEQNKTIIIFALQSVPSGLFTNPSRFLDASLAVTCWDIPVTLQHHGAKLKTKWHIRLPYANCNSEYFSEYLSSWRNRQDP